MSFGFLPLVFNIMFAYGLMYGLFFASLPFSSFSVTWDEVRLMPFFRCLCWPWPTGCSSNIILIIALSGILILLTLRAETLPLFAFWFGFLCLLWACIRRRPVTMRLPHQKFWNASDCWLLWAYRTNLILNACQDGTHWLCPYIYAKKRGISKRLKKC